MRGSLVGNLLRQGAATGASVFLFVLAAVAGRYLGPEDFGIFSFALAFVYFFDVILDPGLYHLFIREIARHREDSARYIRQGLAWKAVASPVVFGLIALGVHLLHESPRIQQVVYLMALAGVIKSVKDVYVSALVANERFGLNAITAILERAGLLIVGAIVLMSGYGLFALCWTFVIVRAVDLVVARQMTLTACGRARANVDWRFLKKLIWAGAPIGALYLTLNVYNYVDTVMISVLRDQTETGWYSASFRIYEGLRIVPDVIAMVLLPSLSRAYAEASGGFARVISTAYKYVFVLALLVTGVGVLLSEDIVRLAFGADYAPSDLALSILLAGLPFIFLVHFLQMVMIATDRQRLLVKVALLGLIANIALNAFVIPVYGYLGAATTTVAVEAVVCAILSFSVYRSGTLSGLLRKMAIALGCWVAAGALAIGPLAASPRWAQASVLAMAFVALLWLTRVVNLSEWTGSRA